MASFWRWLQQFSKARSENVSSRRWIVRSVSQLENITVQFHNLQNDRQIENVHALPQSNVSTMEQHGIHYLDNNGAGWKLFWGEFREVEQGQKHTGIEQIFPRLWP